MFGVENHKNLTAALGTILTAILLFGTGCGPQAEKTGKRSLGTQDLNPGDDAGPGSGVVGDGDGDGDGGGDDSAADGDGSGGDDGGGDDGVVELNAEQTSIEAYKQTLYPVLVENCGRCHGAGQTPFFAAEDPVEAHTTIIDNKKVNFSDPGSSRVVLKVRTGHNPWTGDTNADADVLQGKIEAWVKSLEDAGHPPTEEQLANVTASRAFVDGEMGAGMGDPGTVAMNAADGTIAAPFEMFDDDDDEGLTSYVMAPMNNGQIVAPNGAGGELSFTFDIEQDGIYALWGRVKAPSAAANSFHVSMDGGAFTTWATAITMDAWAWDRANQDNGMTELTYNLTAGTHTIVIKHREEQTRINRIAITDQLDAFTGAAPSRDTWVMRYDLSDLTGKAATLVVEAAEFDAASKTMLLTNLAIETEETLVIEDVMPLVNGKFNPQHATFRLVDQTIEPPGAVLSEASLILLGEDGWEKDTLSFTFGKIE